MNKTFQKGKSEADIVCGFASCLIELLKSEEVIISEEQLAKAKKLDEEKALKEMPKFDPTAKILVVPLITREMLLKL